ncbi:hypothetical protein GFK26_18680 [Variovorax paradoxus]|uniref:Guanylate kinase-like domain-containing protein n=1 Tax=Variovorax paradoxus TaxID=34073 RepID=A0A5Q0M7S1_VARPD|nr:hypothetical protein [Variovorax paradoxus]QFZ84654.1 hypothetical protein GFK26_18680 [Variovorax paradoxus]
MIVTLTGPSCGGKSTLERALQERGYGRAISHTTREARSGEVCGEHYHFINNCTFDAMLARGDFIEIIDLGTRRYAMSSASLELAAQQGNVVIVVEPHGCAQIHDYCKAHNLPVMGVWIDCGPEEQAKRWLSRTVGELALPPAFSKGKLDASTERLGLMLGLESAWRDEALWFSGSKTHPHLYSYWITSKDIPAESLAEELDRVVSARNRHAATA